MRGPAGGEAAPDRAALAALAAEERLEGLGRHVPPLSLARAFGVARDEVRHSRALAEVPDPARHAGAEAILRPLLREVARRLTSRPRGAEGGRIDRAREEARRWWGSAMVSRIRWAVRTPSSRGG